MALVIVANYVIGATFTPLSFYFGRICAIELRFITNDKSKTMIIDLFKIGKEMWQCEAVVVQDYYFILRDLNGDTNEDQRWYLDMLEERLNDLLDTKYRQMFENAEDEWHHCYIEGGKIYAVFFFSEFVDSSVHIDGDDIAKVIKSLEGWENEVLRSFGELEDWDGSEEGWQRGQ